MADTKTSPTSKRPPQVAVAPVKTIEAEDVAENISPFDSWLRSISNNIITLERVKMVAGSLPVVGNIIALADVVSDIIEVVKKKSEQKDVDVFDWLNMGIDLIGVIPIPANLAAARMSLRPMLALIRQKVARMLKESAKSIGESILILLADHLNTKIAGDLETFAQGALAQLKPMLDKASEQAKALCDQIADSVINLIKGNLFNTKADMQAAMREAEAARKSGLRDPFKTFTSGMKSIGHFWVGMLKTGANLEAKAATSLLSEPLKKNIIREVDVMRAIGKNAAAELPKLAKGEKSIAFLLEKLLEALQKRKRPGKTVSGNVHPKKTNEAHKHINNGELEAAKRQKGAKGAPSCKDGTCPVTDHSIGFAMGWERFTHTDFTLSTLIPFAWERTYASNLGVLDNGPLGARWTTDWLCHIEERGDELIYWGADGRPVTFPKLGVGKEHYHAIETLTLSRQDHQTLVLTFTPDYSQRFERVSLGKKTIYRLTQANWPNKISLTLSYAHEASALRHAPSEFTLQHDQKVLAQISSTLDDAGRITALQLLLEGQVVRTLAQYQYDEAGDLIGATDENGAHWDYRYTHHLITRYSDRTGRGINLEWSGADAADNSLAKAVHEWADDGSFDTRLEWDENIRLTYVTDALGNETWHYYDILGYTYRIVHPDNFEEWLFRDDAKNVVKHIHPDGSVDRYDWDERSQLIYHERADGSTLYFDYDEQGHLTTIVDGSGQHWKREYDIAGNLVKEIDPLGFETEYAYNKAGQVVEITDAKGGVKALAYTEGGQLASYTDCSGKTSQWSYDARGRLAAFTDASDAKTQYRYAEGLEAAHAAQAAQATQISGLEDIPPNATGHLDAIEHADGGVERYVQDAEGRLLAHIDPLGRITRYDYTGAGLIAQRHDAQGQTLRYRWDRLGRLTGLQNENDAIWQFHYDPVGRLLDETGFDGQRTHYGYDESTGILAWTLQQPQVSGSISAATQQDGRIPDTDRHLLTRFEFDGLGRLIERSAHWSDAQGQALDAQGRPSSVEQAGVLHREEFAYDGNGRLLLAANAHSHLQWFYDEAGRMVREHHGYTEQDRLAVWRHEYDALGNRTRTHRPDGHSIDWLRYGSGHVHGLLLDGQEAIAFERDDLHREILRSQNNQLQQQRQYDPVGRLLEQVLKASPANPDKQAYNASTTPATTPNTQIQRRYQYDAAGQLQGIQDSRRGTLNYRYDPVGRLIEAQSPLGRETFAFDPASNLLDQDADARSGERRFGAEGNNGTTYSAADDAMRHPRAGHFGQANTSSRLLDNLLKQYAGQHNTYDGLGHLTTRRLNGEVTQFQWNPLGRLERSRNAQVEVSYQYDALGRRISKHSQAIVISASSDGPLYAQNEQRRIAQERGYGLTLYGWDGDLLAWESKVPTATSGAEHHTTHYLYEPGSFVPLLQAATDRPIRLPIRSKIDAPWEYTPRDAEADQAFTHTAYYHCDHLGTPQELTDETGNLVWSAHYKAWGEAQELISAARRKAGLTTNIRFQGQYFDHETGLHYNRHRYYDPHTGRFVSSDPIGLIGGINTYAYTQNAPTNNVDAYGLCSATLNRNLGGKDGDHMQAHHIIPEKVWGNHNAFFKAIGMGEQRDSAQNGLLMPDSKEKAKQMKRQFYHCSRHDVYSAGVDRRVSDIEAEYRSGNITAPEARDRIAKLQNTNRLILAAPGINPIRLF